VSLSYPPYGAATSASVYAQLFDTLGATGDLAIDTRVRLLAGDVDVSMRLLDLRSLEREGYWGLRQFLRFHARNQPLLLIVDDLHRADRSIRTLLFDIVGQLDDVPVLAVCIGRDSQAVWLDGLDQRHIMTLEPLSAEEALLYIKNDEVASSLRSDVVEAIVERASGNPLYLRELLRYEMSFDAQDPMGTNSEDRLLPASLKSVLGARLDAMEKSDKVCIQHVSILGDYATADRIAALGPLSFDVSLRRLVESGVLQQDANGAYSVVDGLLAEVAYETLPHNVRGLRHRTAALLATTHSERAQQFDLAMQYLAEDSSLRAENAQAHAIAGIEALDRANLIEGVSLLWRAVELGYREPVELCRLSHVLIDLGRVGEARRVLQSVVFEASDPRTSDLMLRRDYLYALTYPESEAVTASVDLQRVAQGYADKQDESAYGEALLSLAQLLARMGDDDQAVVVADRAYEALLTSDDMRRVLIARRIRSQLRPDQSEVLSDLLRDLEAVEKLNDRSLLVDWLSAIAQDEFVATYDAYPDDTQQLESTLLRLIDVARDLGMSDLEVVGCSLLGVLCRFQGRASEAIQYIGRTWQLEVSDNEELDHLRRCADFVVGLVSDPLRDDVPYATSRRDTLAVASNLITQAGLLLHGRSVEARHHVQASLEGHTGVGRSWIRYRLNYARSLADSHQYADAKAIADECLNLSSRQRSRSMRACALSLVIELTGALDSSAILPDKLGPVRGIVCLEELAVIRARRFYAPNLDDRQVVDQAAEDTLAGLGADLILLSGR
jgi:tetratricopeptide (TPR) repeat protein